jgi:hypothetical protein
MVASTFEKNNALALSAAEKRIGYINAGIQHIDSNLATRQYAAADQNKLEKLESDLGKAKTAIDKEISARQELQEAYDQSTYANKDADPAVKAKKKKLANVRKANKPVMHKRQNMVNNVCQPCLDKEIENISDCNAPYYVKYGNSGGPRYKDCHNHTLDSFSGWDELIDSNTKTASEKNVLVAMSANEGDMDAVQAYDSEVATVGAMQKTVKQSGKGELPKQLQEFRDNPLTSEIFDRELGSKGYTIGPEIIGENRDGTLKYGNIDNTLYFTDPKNPNAQPITGRALDQFIQTNRDRWGDTLGPFRSLGRTPEFQRKQVLDFNDRLVKAMDKIPDGYAHEIGSYVTSERGAALVLDQDVNRPGYVKPDFGTALDKFYNTNPHVSKDPSTWAGNQRQAYEQEILDNYIVARRGTDMDKRAAKISEAGLNDAPNTLTFPPNK